MISYDFFDGIKIDMHFPYWLMKKLISFLSFLAIFTCCVGKKSDNSKPTNDMVLTRVSYRHSSQMNQFPDYDIITRSTSTRTATQIQTSSMATRGVSLPSTMTQQIQTSLS